jgi:hypothetical protein
MLVFIVLVGRLGKVPLTMSTPKKHHFIPQFLLRNFTDHRGPLVIYPTDQERVYGAVLHWLIVAGGRLLQ